MFAGVFEKYSFLAGEWGSSFLVAIFIFLFVNWFVRYSAPKLARFAEKTDTMIDDVIVALIDKIHPLFVLIASLYVGMFFMPEHSHIFAIGKKVFMTAFWIQMLLLGVELINFWIKRYELSRLDGDQSGITMVLFAGMIGKASLSVVCGVIILDSLGFNVTGLVAGLGIGGLAIAIAVQNVLGDLFASISIIMDKPFVVGDSISTGEVNGTVEHIGLKSTRIRSVNGEQVICANGSLLKSTIKNYKRMQERRVLLEFGVAYESSLENLNLIPKIVSEIIERQKDCRLDRVHFKSYGPSSLDFETVYFVLNADYNLHMDIQQKINLEIFEQFAIRKNEFAYPTQKLYVNMEKPTPTEP